MMVLDPECNPLKRSWCLFEVLQTFQLQNENDNFGFLFGTARGILNDSTADEADVGLALSVAREIATLDLRDASAADAADKMMIDVLVERTGGFHVFNNFVRGKMHETLRSMQRDVLENFTKLQNQLLMHEAPPQVEKDVEEGNEDQEYELATGYMDPASAPPANLPVLLGRCQSGPTTSSNLKAISYLPRALTQQDAMALDVLV
jgi:hypothetical protein